MIDLLPVNYVFIPILLPSEIGSRLVNSVAAARFREGNKRGGARAGERVCTRMAVSKFFLLTNLPRGTGFTRYKGNNKYNKNIIRIYYTRNKPDSGSENRCFTKSFTFGKISAIFNETNKVVWTK